MNKPKVEDYYNAIADKYHEQYNRYSLLQLKEYPANFFRLQILINSFISSDIKRIIEVGVGEGTPLVSLAKAGIEAWGFDISENMVSIAKENMKKAGLNSDHIFHADIQDPISYCHCLKDGLFDGLIAMGVMPHVENDEMVLKNMMYCIKPEGKLFVEFRNKLFSLFTFNRYTLEFILDDLLLGVNPKLKELVRKDLEQRLRVDLPPIRDKVKDKDAPGYDSILSKFHIPFEVKDLFEKIGLKNIKFHWYHYHPAMPYLESSASDLFRLEAIRLEHETSGWRGMFLCSAFVIEATR